MRRFAAGLVLLVALLDAAPQSRVRLVILHTSDLHGRVHPHDALADRDLGGGLARVAASVLAIRAEGNPTLLLDSGDTIQGAPEQALVFAGRLGAGSGDPIVQTMNLLRYDAMAVGNHEFDFGSIRREISRREARFPWLCANAYRPNGVLAFEPYVVREVQGVRVGILGLITWNTGSWLTPATLGDLRFGDSVEAARRWVPVLRGKERCDVVVVITHQGFERDPVTGEESGEDQGHALATGVSGIDLLLTGHTHKLIAPRRLGQTWISQPGRWGEALSRFDLTLEKRDGRWLVTDMHGRNLPMRSVAPDPKVVGAVEELHAASMRLLAEPLAELEAPASARGARTGDSGLLDWLHEVQLRQGRADLSFASLLPARLPDWPAGPLTLRQIWTFYPYENSLVVLEASGRDVRMALERSASCATDSDRWLRQCDSLEGADYILDLSRPQGQRVASLTRNGRPVRDSDLFRVALNSYRASGGAGYAMWKARPRLAEGGNVRDLLVADAAAKRRLRLRATGNWKVEAAASVERGSASAEGPSRFRPPRSSPAPR